jgi:hypothetical protein
MDAKKKQDSLEAIRWPLKALKQEEARLHGYVNLARKDGASWAEIGRVLGVTRQAAQKRFGKAADALG